MKYKKIIFPNSVFSETRQDITSINHRPAVTFFGDAPETLNFHRWLVPKV